MIPSPSPSVKIRIMGGKVCLWCKGKTLLGVFNKLLKTKILCFITSSKLSANNLNFHWRWWDRIQTIFLNKTKRQQNCISWIRNDVSFIFLSWVICTSVFTKLYVEIDALKNMFDIFFVSLIKVQEVCRRGVLIAQWCAKA